VTVDAELTQILGITIVVLTVGDQDTAAKVDLSTEVTADNESVVAQRGNRRDGLATLVAKRVGRTIDAIRVEVQGACRCHFRGECGRDEQDGCRAR